MATVPATATAPPRALGFRLFAGIVAALTGILAFGLLALVLPWIMDGDRVTHRVHDLSWGVVGGLFITVALLAQLRRPERRPAAMQTVLATAVGLVIGGAVFTGEFDGFLIPIVVLPVALALAHPARSEVFALRGRPSPLMLAMVGVSTVPLVAWALDQAALQRDLPAADPHVDEGHFAGMAATAVAIALVALVAALKTGGWIVPARLAAAGIVVMGVASLVFDGYASALPALGAWAAIGGGVAFALVAEAEYRRERARA